MILFFTVGIIMIISGITMTLLPKKQKTITQYAKLKEGQTIEVCPNQSCGLYSTLSFRQIETNIKEEAFLKKVEEINEQSTTYYKEVTSSAQTACTTPEAQYQYPLRIDYSMDVTTQENIINIFTYTEKYNQCTNESTLPSITSYFYDLEEEKEITSEEYIAKKGLSEEIVNQAISKVLNKQYEKKRLDTSLGTTNNQYFVKSQKKKALVYYYSPIDNAWLTLTEKEIKNNI